MVVNPRSRTLGRTPGGLPMASRPADRTKAYHDWAKILSGCTVLVTGATGGLGSAVAKGCAREGATVVLLSRTIPKLERVYDEIVAAGSPATGHLPAGSGRRQREGLLRPGHYPRAGARCPARSGALRRRARPSGSPVKS